MNVFKNKKVVAALVVLALALVSAGLGVDLGTGASEAITNVICQVVTCS